MRCAARAGARGEILGDLAQDLPLLGVRVLRLVDQHVVDAAIELVEHPGRVAAREQREGLVDEVLEVERAEAHLRLLDARVDLGGEREERPGALGGARGLALVDERAERDPAREQRVLQARLDSLGEEGRALARRTAVREEDREVVLELSSATSRPRRQPTREAARFWSVALPASSSCAMAGQSPWRDAVFEHRALDAVERLVRSPGRAPCEAAQGLPDRAGTACIAAPRRWRRRAHRPPHRR